MNRTPQELLAGVGPRVDVEALIAHCLPRGELVDPSELAKNLREWFAENAPVQQALTEADITGLLPDWRDEWDKGIYGMWVARAVERAHGIMADP